MQSWAPSCQNYAKVRGKEIYFRRDCGSVELVEYAAFRLLRLRNALALQKPPHRQILKIVEVAWDVVNLYGCTVLVDSLGIYLSTQHSNSFCICDEKFVLVRNGFFVIGSAETGECRSHILTSAVGSSNPEPFKSVLRPCVVDAIFVGGSLYIIALLSPETSDKSVFGGVFKIHKDDSPEKPPVLLHVLPSPVGKWFPFLVLVPKFVIKPPKWTKYLHVFALGEEVPCIYRLSTSNPPEPNPPHARLELPSGLERLEYLSLAMLAKEKRVTLYILIRHGGEQVRLFRFVVQTNPQGSELFKIVEETGLKICDDKEENVCMWQFCLTNHGQGVGVASPQGDFYRLKAPDGLIVLQKIESPFRASCHVKYVSRCSRHFLKLRWINSCDWAGTMARSS